MYFYWIVLRFTWLQTWTSLKVMTIFCFLILLPVILCFVSCLLPRLSCLSPALSTPTDNHFTCIHYNVKFFNYFTFVFLRFHIYFKSAFFCQVVECSTALLKAFFSFFFFLQYPVWLLKIYLKTMHINLCVYDKTSYTFIQDFNTKKINIFKKK